MDMTLCDISISEFIDYICGIVSRCCYYYSIVVQSGNMFMLSHNLLKTWENGLIMLICYNMLSANSCHLYLQIESCDMMSLFEGDSSLRLVCYQVYFCNYLLVKTISFERNLCINICYNFKIFLY